MDDRNRRQLDVRRGESNWRASNAAVAKTAALSRLTVGIVTVMEVTGASVRREMFRRRGVAVRGDRAHLDREATVHGTGVQLDRLGQTHGEPQR